MALAALNLLAPGLAQMRLAHPRTGLALLLTPHIVLLALSGLAAVAPPPGFVAYLVIVPLLIAGAVALCVGAVLSGWRLSRHIGAKPWWSRWYALAALWLLSSCAAEGESRLFHRFYKTFYAPSESMMPAIARNDHFLADMRAGRSPRRGDIILFQAADSKRLGRVAAIAGDSIAMRAGVPVVNGQQATQQADGSIVFAGYAGPQSARRLMERLPGETGSHFIFELDGTPFDTMPAVRVPEGHVFVLGDNRDRSADSRIPPEYHGVGMVPVSAILGQPLFIYWSDDRSRIGKQPAK